MSETPSIRRATHKDVPSILAMIKELATYEEALDRVQATEESLRATLTFAPCASDPHPPTRTASTFILSIPSPATSTDPTASDNEPKEQVIGMALYFRNYSTWRSCSGIYLEDLYIRPAHRRRGFGTLLLKRLAREALEVSGGKGRLEWSCLKWNESALAVYEGIGASKMEEWVGLRMEGEVLERFAGGV